MAFYESGFPGRSSIQAYKALLHCSPAPLTECNGKSSRTFYLFFHWMCFFPTCQPQPPHLHTHINIHTCEIYRHIKMYIYTPTCMCTNTNRRARTYTHKHTETQASARTHTNTRGILLPYWPENGGFSQFLKWS